MLDRLKELGVAAHDRLAWLLLAVSVTAIVFVWRMRKKKPEIDLQPRYLEMAREGRKTHISRVFVKRAGDALLDAAFDGELSDKEVNDAYCWLCRELGQEDMVPLIRDRRPRIVKEALKAQQRRRSMAKKEPAVLPEPKTEPKSNGAMPETPDLHAILHS